MKDFKFKKPASWYFTEEYKKNEKSPTIQFVFESKKHGSSLSQPISFFKPISKII